MSVAILILIVIFSHVRSESIRKKEAEKLNREIQLAHNELKALRAQMDPHFIFNSLSSIQNFIMTKDEESALRYLNKFAKLMRMILSNSERSFITLREEINALKLYMELEALRWENKFEYSIEVDPNVDIDDCASFIKFAKSRDYRGPVVAATYWIHDAISLYELGADYVVVPEEIGGKHIAHMLSHNWSNLFLLKKARSKNFEELMAHKVF